MDYLTTGFSVGSPSTTVSKFTDNDSGGQRDDVNPALPRESSRGSDADAATVGLDQRAVTAGPDSSIQGVANIIPNADPSGCLFRLVDRADNTKKMQWTELVNFKESIDELCVLKQPMSPELSWQLSDFVSNILELALPLCQPEIHDLLEHVNEIKVCLESDQPNAGSIKSSLTSIEDLYPAFLESRHPVFFQLADYLLAHGFIKNEESRLIGSYGVEKFIDNMMSRNPEVPISRFRQHITPLVDNAELKRLWVDKPGLFLSNKNDAYFQFWEIFIEINVTESLVQLLDKVFADVYNWVCYPDALFIRYPDRLKQTLTADLDKYCKGSVADFEKGVSFRCEGLRQLNKLLERPCLAVPLSDFLVDYFSSLTEQQRQFFSVLLFANNPPLFERLLDAPLGQPLLENIISWRSKDNATVFHSGFEAINSHPFISDALLEQVMQHCPEMLNARDSKNRTVLESFFYFDCYFEQSLDDSGLQRLVNETADGGIDPCHVVALLNQVDSSKGFHAWLALHILRKPNLIRGGPGAIDTALLANDFARNFLSIVLSGEELLQQLQSLPFSKAARKIITRQLPIATSC